MIGWLKNLNDASRLISINEASRISGISAKAIEKDWWVTLSLKLVFNTPYANHFAFKGGTSLSKGWQLIDRFSEDIDISLSSEAVGIAYAESPSKTFVVSSSLLFIDITFLIFFCFYSQKRGMLPLIWRKL